MPTRILVNETIASRQNTPRFRSTNNRNLSLTDIESVGEKDRNKNKNKKTGTEDENNADIPKTRKSSRKIVRLKSSIIRGKRDSFNIRALSSEDIRASPRLLGYCFQLLASIVMLISVSTFYQGEADSESSSPEIWSLVNSTRVGNDVFLSPDGRYVRIWKLIGCFIVSTLGTTVTLGIIIVHFDTIFCPSFWLRTFRDGSKHEQSLLILLAVFWGIGIHINTSSLSVGESQPNVYFTSWISFLSSILNYGIWRISAGQRSIAEMVNNHHRETTYNWLWVLFCTIIFAGAICDTYWNRSELDLSVKGAQIDVPWILVISITWGLVLISFVSVILNHFLRKSCELRMFGGKKGSFVLLGWRQAEGLVALIITVALFYIVFSYTGGNGLFNGLNNVYFGVWGAFINSVMLLAAWLRENKNIDFIKNDEKNRDNQIDVIRR